MAELEVPADERDDIAGDPEEQRLTEAHDARVAPAQVEADRQQRQDQHVGRQRDQLRPRVEQQRCQQGRRQRGELDDRQDPAAAGFRSERGQHSFGSTIGNLPTIS
jgi:hypothetical protein